MEKSIENGIGKAISKRGKPSQAERSRLAMENERTFEEIHREQAEKLRGSGGRWEHATQEEIISDYRMMLEEKDLSKIPDELKGAAIYAKAMNDQYSAMGSNYSQGNVLELVRRIEKAKK